MKIATIIPARYQSSRFEGKPLAPIHDKPMIQHVYERAARSRAVDITVVATDDKRIQEAVEQFDGKVIMTNTVHQSGTDRLAEAAQILTLDPDDIVINVQGDQPLIDPRSIDQVLKPFETDHEPQMSTLGFRIVDPREKINPKDVKVVFDRQGNALYFSRAPIPFGRDKPAEDMFKHLGVYAYRRKFLDTFNQFPQGRLENIEKLEQLRALENGASIRVVITPFDSPEVDIPDDIKRIESLMDQMKV
ncbi:MAG: 3-deoxy-manno-octulosonate cytidylyltransferase (CMP-KDO synthetase) [Candidatus Magnetoglobus multicellularis str. Araruama]|uniref:3-deoxy-manno-octulosonate cytidylyltransferase n=1 Tax=Candidatus Magnetoglobus multicellularis str. Araruama TaxID=890399 RepID=A0A1V1P2F9_9BACT|nr:MAG: 3-deoxy-manno-octulosonate cytidylyltransferase (CMP-KDO synthetase) [Candidatus Magnetoglobus multicellularis str. Araruama]